MAQRVQVLLVCDLHDDETPGDETVSFALDGATYEIDVCDQHATQLRDAFSPYVGGGRRSGGRALGPRRTGRRPSGPAAGGGPVAAGRQRSAEIRAWARERGLQVNERGRIPASIVEQYQAAHS